jgi:hypothetical protein
LTETVAAQPVDGDGRVLTNPEVAFIYDQTQLRTFELNLRNKDLAFLDADPTAEEYVSGSLTL